MDLIRIKIQLFMAQKQINKAKVWDKKKFASLRKTIEDG